MNLYNIYTTSVLYALFIVGILGAGSLVLEELNTGNGCPKIGVIPACVIILICFIIPLISHILKKWNSLYFIFTGIAAVIAIYASILQYTGNGECPKTADGNIPMCYFSFLIFSNLIIVKLLIIRNSYLSNTVSQ